MKQIAIWYFQTGWFFTGILGPLACFYLSAHHRYMATGLVVFAMFAIPGYLFYVKHFTP